MTTARTTNTANAHALTPVRRTAGVRLLAVDQGCHPDWFKEKSFPKRSETFLDLWTVGRATVDEEVGSSHSLGIGVAVSGGHWSASGSVTVETHSSAGGSNDYSHNYQLRNYVNYGHYKRLCFKLNKKGQTVGYYRHRVSATSMHSLLVGGTRIKDHVWGDTRAQWRPKCTHYTSGRYHKTRGGNIDFEAGVNAPYISLHARASFSRNTTVTWRPPRSGSWICGTGNSGWVDSKYAGEDKNPGPSPGGCGARCQIVSDGKDPR